MSKSNIAKFAAFVILSAVTAGNFSGCTSKSFGGRHVLTNSAYADPTVVGHIADLDITEASGIAASKCQPGIFWTHNDSGDDAFIYAINATGDNLGTWRINGAINNDWV